MSANLNTDNFEDYQVISSALDPYVQGAKTGDGALIRSAFFDHATITGWFGGVFSVMDLDTFQAVTNDGGPSPELEHHVASIDISGPAAAVKLEFKNWLGNRFTDFLILNEHDGNWKISGKIYDDHTGRQTE